MLNIVIVDKVKGDFNMSKKSAENETMDQISIKLPKSLIERYNEYAKSKSNPRSHFMREALVEYIERKEKK
jgi:predicted DNA-binding protein